MQKQLTKQEIAEAVREFMVMWDHRMAAALAAGVTMPKAQEAVGHSFSGDTRTPEGSPTHQNT